MIRRVDTGPQTLLLDVLQLLLGRGLDAIDGGTAVIGTAGLARSRDGCLGFLFDTFTQCFEEAVSFCSIRKAFGDQERS